MGWETFIINSKFKKFNSLKFETIKKLKSVKILIGRLFRNLYQTQLIFFWLFIFWLKYFLTHLLIILNKLIHCNKKNFISKFHQKISIKSLSWILEMLIDWNACCKFTYYIFEQTTKKKIELQIIAVISAKKWVIYRSSGFIKTWLL